MTNTVLLIDNYDSFVFNLARYLEELGIRTDVRRNDAVTVAEIRELAPVGILISPGPCAPDQAGISLEVIQELAGEVPILGVCLGHQAIGQAFGGRVIRAPEPVHGRSTLINHVGHGLFEALPCPLQVARYHSLIVERSTLPACLKVTAETPDGLIMAVQHTDLPVYGVQFHPESILTLHGLKILTSFLKICGCENLISNVQNELSVELDSSEVDDFYRRDFEQRSPK